MLFEVGCLVAKLVMVYWTKKYGGGGATAVLVHQTSCTSPTLKYVHALPDTYLRLHNHPLVLASLRTREGVARQVHSKATETWLEYSLTDCSKGRHDDVAEAHTTV